MSKRRKLGDEAGSPESSHYDPEDGAPPLSPPDHHFNLPNVALSSEGLPGFDPIPVPVTDPPQVSDEPCLNIFDHSVQCHTSPPPEMGHKSPGFPDFEDFPTHTEETSIPDSVLHKDDISAETAHNVLPFETGDQVCSTSLTLDITDKTDHQISSTSLTMDMDEISLIPSAVHSIDSTPHGSITPAAESLSHSNVPQLFDDPSAITDVTDTGDELLFHDTLDFSVDDDFCEEVDPVFNQFQEDEESGLPSLFYETDQFYDAYDAAPFSSSDGSYQPGADVPLYKGAKVTLHDAAAALLTLVLGCKISGEVFSLLLNLLNLLLPEDHKLFRTVFTFYKHFEYMKSLVNLIYFCSTCCQSLKCKDSQCTNCKTKTKVGFYIHVPLFDQLKRLYARPGFTDLLSYRHKRSKINPDNYEDIYDGELYKSIASNMGPMDISCFWNADGISLYSSSSFQVWPFYFSINELPPHLRHKEENILLGGIAFGYEKPHPNLLMKPIFEEVQLLRTKGIDVTVPDSNSPVNIKCNVLCGSCDAPAKAVFMRMTQFNGSHGCHLCLAKGEKSERTGKVFVYPAEDVLQPRTEEQYHDDVLNHTHGIKGPTYLSYMVFSFFLSSTAVDVMHCVYLGVCRQIFSLWLNASFIKQVFGENAEKKPLLDTLSKLFCSFSPPHYFNRPPRDLKHMKYFKASEFRIWLFSTALPVFEKYMKEPYLGHFKKLVCAISHLNQSSVSKNDVEIARQLLKSFVHQWQDLFGLRHMSYNVHCLLHLSDVVSLFGPLFVSSCFAYENINGVLARLVHGTRYAGLQITTILGLLRNVPSLINSIVNSDVKSFCLAAMSHRNRLAVTEKLDTNTYVIGKVQENHNIDPVFLQILSRAFQNMTPNFFFRLKKDGFLYVSRDYGRGVRDSSNVKYVFQGQVVYGCIKVFVKVVNRCYAIIQRYITSYCFYVDQPVRATVPSLLKIVESDLVEIVPIDDLQSVCFKMSVDSSTMYLSTPLNNRELE